MTYPCLWPLIEDDNFDAVLVISGVGMSAIMGRQVASSVPAATREQAAEFLKLLEDNELDNLDRVFEYMDRYQKPVIMSNPITEAFRESRTFKKLRDNGVMMYPTPERAVKALAALVQYSRYLKGA